MKRAPWENRRLVRSGENGVHGGGPEGPCSRAGGAKRRRIYQIQQEPLHNCGEGPNSGPAEATGTTRLLELLGESAITVTWGGARLARTWGLRRITSPA
jgi:hypothetical protein